MTDDALTTEEYRRWLTPLQAYAVAMQSVEKENAGTVIWERLKGGLVRTACASSSVAYYNTTPDLVSVPELIQRRYWQHIATGGAKTFWDTGDVRFDLPGRQNSGRYTVRCVGVRLNPEDLRTTLPPPKPKPTPQVAPPTAPAATPAVVAPEVFRGDPVAVDHLKHWFELYRRVYTGSQDTEATALMSAQGMFPGKFVSRERVRALRGAQKVGRKLKRPTD